jgi:hypothetical protein
MRVAAYCYAGGVGAGEAVAKCRAAIERSMLHAGKIGGLYRRAVYNLWARIKASN